VKPGGTGTNVSAKVVPLLADDTSSKSVGQT
jgi:hypothetical protein